MRVLRILARDVPVTSPGANAVVNFSHLTTTLVAIETDLVKAGRAVIGYGFSSLGRYGVADLVNGRFARRLMEAAPDLLRDETGTIDPERCWKIAMANEKPGGHGERAQVLGCLDMAFWDAVAKARDVPLWRLLADRYNECQGQPRVAVYAAGGYYTPGKDKNALTDELKAYLDLGYKEAKIKIGGLSLAEDMRRIEAAIAVLGDASRLAVDANGRFDLQTALAYADALKPLGLRWYEEAGDPLDFRLQAVLAEHYEHPLATGENLFSSQDAHNLLRYGGMRPDRDILQFDCGLSYGLPDYLRTLATMRGLGWHRRQIHPHGGHQMSLHLAAGLGLGGNEAYPGVFQPFGGFADGTPIEDGTVEIPDAPGIGLELKQGLAPILRDLAG